ncbi:adaptin N terminal region-domain-containing protein [Syncephalis plumigaleata]|nr:adaptin N terminal region-domain-containing protein [Syncephalis plumigaleata]
MVPENCYTVVQSDPTQDQPSLQELRTALEKGSDSLKITTLKRILRMMASGDPCEGLLMHVIRFVLPSKNKNLKKLLHFYWELCPKTNEDGKLKQEMILVCNALRNDLQHPNEYIRASTLRFLCKLREAEILEPLVPTARACLEHRHSYVRRNAAFAIYSIYKTAEHLIPDAPELMQTFLVAEADVNCKRNAFIMLCNCAPELAVDYLKQVYGQVASYDELMQLAIIEFIRKDSRNNLAERSRYIRCVVDLLNAKSHAVNMMQQIHSPAAIKAAAGCYIELAVKEADNNVKLIVLDRFRELHVKYEHVLDDSVMDVLRVLHTPDIDVRRKTLDIALQLANNRTVQDVVTLLKKELSKSQGQEYDKSAEYRQVLVQSIHTCAIKFPNVAADVEVVEKFPALRAEILERLLDAFEELKSGKVFRGALWIVGEYSLTVDNLDVAWEKIKLCLGELPLLASEQRALAETDKSDDSNEQKIAATPAARRILPDGTYASESALSDSSRASKVEAVKASTKPPLRSLLLAGDYFLGTVLATTIVKMVLHYAELKVETKKLNSLRAEAMLILTGFIRIGRSEFPSSPIDEDSYERILTCLRVLDRMEDEVMQKVFTHDCKHAYVRILQEQERIEKEKKKQDSNNVAVQADDLITFRQFHKREGGDADEYELDVTRAAGLDTQGDLGSMLSRVVQLTGFSDPVYAEAYVTTHQFDILLDLLVVNQTNETLQNLSIEFATLGDLKLVEKPSQYTIAPHRFQSIKANIKVSSTEAGVIFGNIVYDRAGSSDGNCVVMSDIQIDIMDYINPATCTENQFRNMWTEFEWENKINVVTSITDLREYLKFLQKRTNMNCLTPPQAMSGDCGFLSANLYARSIFGEDALANLSIEKRGDAPITGHIRIRSKTQGIALSLGDKISNAQKTV